MKVRHYITGAAFVSIAASSHGANLLVNGDFETDYTGIPEVPGQGFAQEGVVPGWSTTASDDNIEIWGSGYRSIYAANGTTAQTDGGDYFAELNASKVSTLYQDIEITEVGLVDYTFLHRARGYNDPSKEETLERRYDVMTFTITNLGTDATYGTADDVVEYTRTVSTDNISDEGEYNGWVQYYGNDVFTSIAGNIYRFSYEAVSTGNDTLSNTVGNFIDTAAFGINVVPEPSSAALILGFASLAVIARRRRN
jgi:hypothetical protein